MMSKGLSRWVLPVPAGHRAARAPPINEESGGQIAHSSSVQAWQHVKSKSSGLRLLEARPLEPQPETLGAAALDLIV
jgi:hypothetical protein